MNKKLHGSARGRKASPITAFKKLWPTLTEAERKRWLALFSSDTTQREIRAEISSQLGVHLMRDKQLTGVRQWIDDLNGSAQPTLAAILNEAAPFPEVHDAFVRAFGLLAMAKLKAGGNRGEKGGRE